MRWLLLAVLGCLSACGSSPARVFAEQPVLAARNSSVANELLALPPPTQKLYVGVFAFQDQTGQHKPNENFADYSFAVTQGGATILINALKEAGQEKWFGVLERARIGDLLQERQIIRANREGTVGPNGKQLPPLGPILNAGIIFEGGIVGYDSNVVTGGIGANVLGIGANINYRRDTVAVYLRAVSVLSGEVLVSVTTDKTIYSTGLQGSANRFVSFNSLFQFEAGFTTNEPGQLAVRQAVEKSVYAAIMEGAEKGLWSFADKEAQQRLVNAYVAQRDGHAAPVSAASHGASPAAVPNKEAGSRPSGETSLTRKNPNA
jgi:curli production assembly/transport component CsgG